MSGFRQQLHNQSVSIISRMLNANDFFASPGELHILRRAWECSKFGNVLLAALDEVAEENGGAGCSEAEFLSAIIDKTGFLTKRELWYSHRIKNLVVYRGCDQSEVDNENLGFSWTLSREVAEFFAGRGRYENPVVVTMNIQKTPFDCCVWLDTPEHEVIFFGLDTHQITVETAGGSKKIDWENRPRLLPIPTKIIITAPGGTRQFEKGAENMSNTDNTTALQTASEIVQELHGCAAGDLIGLDHQQQAEALKTAAAGGTEAFVSTLIFLLPLHLRTAAAEAWAA